MSLPRPMVRYTYSYSALRLLLICRYSIFLVVRDATDELLHAAEKAVEAINLSDGMKGCDWLYLHTVPAVD